MRIVLEDKKGYGREGDMRRVERADKRDIRNARRAKEAQRRAFAFA